MSDFSHRVLEWFDRAGRKDLPWQQDINPYRVWVSEIMLQQTQVSTVIPYFERFMDRFPNVETLARAPIDEVLHLWTGLGYYARARNLHRTAQRIVADAQGEFPTEMTGLIALPGIGRSTAGAIVSIACGGRAPILDGNVKRVLARHRRVAGWPGQAAVSNTLWGIAEEETPLKRVADYTQAIMDLGATVCLRRRPRCDACPVAADCEARRHNDVAAFPGKKPSKAVPRRARFYGLMITPQNELLLIRRPEQGIWGGLWCFPEFETREALNAWINETSPGGTYTTTLLPDVAHTFSHFQLTMHPHCIRLQNAPPMEIASATNAGWFPLDDAFEVGLPAPVATTIASLRKSLPPTPGDPS